MTFSEFAAHMYPQWLLGLFMIWVTYKSNNRDLLRVELPALRRFAVMLCLVSIYRYFVLKYAPQLSPGAHDLIKNITLIPWPATLTVFWEDAAHGLPLVLLYRLLGDKWWTGPVYFLSMGFVMLSFGSGHLYQGVLPAIFLSAYIPFSVIMGQKRGFGTMMIGHTLYDLCTVLTLKMLTG